MEHPVIKAILEQNKSSLASLLAEHSESIDSINVPFPNEEEENKQPHNNRYFNWQFVPTEGEHLETPLETAARIGWLDGVKLLLEKGASPRHEKRRAFHDPPCALLWACKEGHVDVVKTLLENGADVDCTHKTSDNGDTRTPLFVALNYQRLPIIRILIDAGADINKKVPTGNGRERPPLLTAMIIGEMDYAKLLIGAGADVNALDDTTFACFYYPYRASGEFIKELMKLWMQAGGKIDVDGIRGSCQDWYDHCGGFGRPWPLPEELQLYRDRKIYELTLQDRERIVTRQKLIENANGRSILTAIKTLPLPEKMKNFLAFDCFEG